jgi:MFS family permease
MTAVPEDSTEVPRRHDTFAALRFRDFRLLVVGRTFWALGEQMLNAAIGWEIYERTGSAFAIGLVGLVQVLPVIVLALPAGHIADRVNRKYLTIAMQVLLALCGLGLAWISFTQGSLVLFYLILLLTGIGAAFHGPASSTLVPASVDPEHFQSAATWSSSSWQIASMVGPALAGWLIAAFAGAGYIYLFNALGCATFIVLLLLMRERPLARINTPMTRSSLTAGVKFILGTRDVLAAMTLDMFAVLFGSATALLPVYAKDVLMVGPEGFGILRAAPSIGAMSMAIFIASRPPFRNAGRALLLAVAGFGVATIIFGLSTSFFLSVAMLWLLGALDNISVVVRQTLLLVRVPDEMRGRISAISSVFIGSSNEIGSFESGVVASLFGPIFAVVSGGIGTLAVVAVVAAKFPSLRRLKELK